MIPRWAHYHCFKVLSALTEHRLFELKPNFNPFTGPLWLERVSIRLLDLISQSFILPSSPDVAIIWWRSWYAMQRIAAVWSRELLSLAKVTKSFFPVYLSHVIMLLSFETENIFSGVVSIAVMHLVCPLYSMGSEMTTFLNLLSRSM